jgi:hypothetical protein
LKNASSICIECEASTLKEGLFGQVFLFLFEILPYLHQHSIFPAWKIRSSLYGQPPDYVAIPGVLDLAYTPPPGPYRTVPLKELRAKYCNVLGNDWDELSRIWHAYFKIPQRILDQADTIPGLETAVGLHYRGTDKLTTTTDSNPITGETFLTLTLDFLASRPDTQRIFVATDDFSFVEKLRNAVELPVINLGEVTFHKLADPQVDPTERADRALLDCLLLSRCGSVLQTSSALSSFAKILNPGLEIYRCASSKLFAEIPYFPVAYVPHVSLKSPEANQILEASMTDDWTSVPAGTKYLKPFAYKARKPFRSQFWNVVDTLKGQ